MAVPGERQVTFQLWPPSDTTRNLVVARMEHYLVGTKIYGSSFDQAEAAKYANGIEEQAFVVAEQQHETCRGETEKVLTYAKQASELMLKALKSQRSEDSVFDISRRKRAFLTKEEAEILFKPFKATSYTSIILSNWSFGKDAARVAGEALLSAKGKLDAVNLADIVAGRPEAEALEVMTTLSNALAGNKLKTLNLSDNALGEKGVRAFSALLKTQSWLESLYFMNNGISEEAAQAICELLPSAQHLRTLHFHNNMTGDGGAEALAVLLAKAPLLEDFQCSSTRVSSDGGVALAKGLEAGSCLKRIDLRDNMFGIEAGVALSRTLRRHPDLTEAYLSDLGLEDAGVIALAQALEIGASNLTVLELGGNEITSAAASAIASCIKSRKHLTRVSLTENELKDRGSVIICEALKSHESLLELDLSSNAISDDGALAVARSVGAISGLNFSLDGNRISPEGILAVKKGFGDSGLLFSFEDQDDENSYAEEEEEEGRAEEEEDGAEEEEDGAVGAMSGLKV